MNHRLPSFTTHTKSLLAVAITVAGLVFSATAQHQIFAQAETATDSSSTSETTPVAQDSVGLTAIPPRMGEDNSLLLQPGEKKQITVRVKNISEQSYNVRSSAQDFTIDEDGQTPLPITTEVSNRWSLASWLTITPNFQQLGPNQTGAVTVLIEVPEDALPGGHYAMVLHNPDQAGSETTETLALQSSDTGVTQRVGTLLYVIVDGPINEEAFVRDFAFAEFSEFGPVPYSFTVENASDIHLRPQIGIEIYNMLGQRVDSIQTESKNIFPLSSRAYEGEWERIWGWGMYTAKLTMSFGTGGQVAIAKTKFWLIPIKLVLTVVLILLAIIAATIAVRRHAIHRRDSDTARVRMLEEKVKRLESSKLKDLEK